MTRETIQIETNRQLRLLDRKKGKPSDGTAGPGSRTELTDKGCRVLTIEEARLRKRRVEERLEADTQKQQRFEGKVGEGRPSSKRWSSLLWVVFMKHSLL